MDYKEPKKRVTKNDKKHRKQVYSQKHVRIALKSMYNNNEGKKQTAIARDSGLTTSRHSNLPHP